jgi:uncharacterized RDD family membrane protein YckC
LIYPLLAFRLAFMFRAMGSAHLAVTAAGTHAAGSRFIGGTSPLALGYAAALIAVYLMLMLGQAAEFGKTLPGISRRILAAVVDFILAGAIAGPIPGLVLVVVAWRNTHVFHWIVQRNPPGPIDVFEALGVLFLAVGSWIFYFAWPLMRRRPTPAECIFHFQVVSDDGTAIPFGRAVSRAFYGPITGLWSLSRRSSSPIYKIKEFQLDEDFDTHAVLIR